MWMIYPGNKLLKYTRTNLTPVFGCSEIYWWFGNKTIYKSTRLICFTAFERFCVAMLYNALTFMISEMRKCFCHNQTDTPKQPSWYESFWNWNNFLVIFASILVGSKNIYFYSHISWGQVAGQVELWTNLGGGGGA